MPDNNNLYANLMFGGTGGTPFDDITSATGIVVGISSITIRSGSEVDAIQVNYILSDGSIYTGATHGGTGGNPTTINLTDDETIISMQGRSGSAIDQIIFTTRNTSGTLKVYGPYGGTGGSPFVVNGVVGGFFGRSGSGLDALGFYLTSPSSQQYGGTGGDVFSDPVLTLDPPAVGIKSITIRSGSEVDSIQMSYLLSDGTTYDGPAHGGSGGSPTTINFAPSEKILAIVGRSGSEIDQLNFLTITDTGQRNTYGPYGGDGGDQFILNAEVLGIFGRSGSELDAVGFYTAYVPIDGVTVYGSDGYLYCVLESTSESNVCSIPVGTAATDLSYRLQYLTSDNASGVGFQVRAPDGTIYNSPSNGTNGVWAVAASPASLGLETFYIESPMAGTWSATVSTSFEANWSVIGTTNPSGASNIAQDAFAQLGPSEKEDVFNGIAPGGTEIPPEFCYFCQAQAVVIMGLAVATFVFWAGPVTATSAVVIYAQRLLGATAASLVSTINNLYTYYQSGTSSWNMARQLCELEGFCPTEEP
jgi:hypothetical protein